MTEPVGLRARKKERTRDAISEAAISLFLARGFDEVSVNDIAAAAEVSKPTLFRYFPTKEDLVIHRVSDHAAEAARVVRARPLGTSPLDALHRHFLDGLDRRDPVTGLNDHPQVLAYQRLVFNTPSLSARVTRFMLDDEVALAEALAEVLHPDIAAGLMSAQILTSQRVLARANWQKLAAGRTADAVHPEAVADADLAFGWLRRTDAFGTPA